MCGCSLMDATGHSTVWRDCPPLLTPTVNEIPFPSPTHIWPVSLVPPGPAGESGTLSTWWEMMSLPCFSQQAKDVRHCPPAFSGPFKHMPFAPLQSALPVLNWAVFTLGIKKSSFYISGVAFFSYMLYNFFLTPSLWFYFSLPKCLLISKSWQHLPRT